MPLKEILDQSKLPRRCRSDLELLLRDYDTTCDSAIQCGREESARRLGRGTLHSTRGALRDATRCKVVGSKVVPKGNFKAAERSHLYTIPPRNTLYPSGADGSQLLASGVGAAGKSADGVYQKGLSNTVAVHQTTDPHSTYSAAFHTLKGRPPTDRELEQVDHHTFGPSSTGGLSSYHPKSKDGRLEASTGQYYYLKRNCVRCGGRMPPAFAKPICSHCANVAGNRTFQIAPLATTSNSNAPKQL